MCHGEIMLDKFGPDDYIFYSFVDGFVCHFDSMDFFLSEAKGFMLSPGSRVGV